MRATMRLDTSDLKAAIASMRSKFPQAMRRALKRTGTSARAEMVKLIAADMGLPSKRVRDEIKVSNDDVSATLVTVGRRIPLIQFQARGPEPSRGRGRGVTYKAKDGRGRLPHAFIATMPSGHRGVFMRTGRWGRISSKTGRGKKYSLERIAERFGPSIAHVFDRYAPQGIERGQEALTKNVKAEINFVLNR